MSKQHIRRSYTNTLAIYALAVTALLAVTAKVLGPVFAYRAVTCLQAHTH